MFAALTVNANSCEKVTWEKGCQPEKAEEYDFPTIAAYAKKG